MATWDEIRKRIFATESGGDYNALYGYQNRQGGLFDDVKITDMTVDDALDFANPKGRYGAFVSTQTPDNRIATPMGAYQVVGRTLRDAKSGLGLKGDELMTPALQDKIGKWIYDTQGEGAWEGLKGRGNMDRKTGGILGAMQNNEEDTPFYKRDSFKDMIGNLAIGLNSMRLNPDPNLAKVVQGQQAQRKAAAQRNRTIEWMRSNGYGEYADMIEAGQVDPKAAIGAIMQQRLGGGTRGVVVEGNIVNPYTGNVIYESPDKGPDIPKTFQSLDMQARAAGFIPKAEGGSGDYEQFMATRGSGFAAEASAAGKGRAKAQTEAAGAEGDIKYVNALIDDIIKDPQLQKSVGGIQGRLIDLSPSAVRFQSKLNQLSGQAFLNARAALKGGGAITDFESGKAEAAYLRLRTSQSEEDFIDALNEFRDALNVGLEKLRKQSTVGQISPEAPQQQDMGSDPLGLRN